MIEERRYDKAGMEISGAVHSASSNGSTTTLRDGVSISTGDALDALDDASSASSLQGGFGSSYITEEIDSDNPYAWAQRLRSIPDKASWQSSLSVLQEVLLQWSKLTSHPVSILKRDPNITALASLEYKSLCACLTGCAA